MIHIIADENITELNFFLKNMAATQTTFLSGKDISPQQLQNTHVLLVRSVTKINQNLLQKTPIQFIGSATAGIDHIDQDYLKSCHIQYVWAPGCNAVAVAEYVLTALFYLLSLKKQHWTTKTVGIIGYGHIGRTLYQRLQRIKMPCLIYDPFVLPHSHKNTLEYVLKNADIISLHTPLTNHPLHATHHLIGKKELLLMKPNACLINTARGEVIDNAALLQHLITHSSFQAILDVWENEPHIDLELLQRVTLGTGHIAGYSLQGKLNGTQEICHHLYHHLKLAKKAEQHPLLKQQTSFQVCTSLTSPFLSQIQGVLKRIYDIKYDSDYFKKQMITEASPEEAFRDYRRHYNHRKEFSTLSLEERDHDSHCESSSSLVNFLKKLGFH